jgi:hypothetical protein
MNQAGELNPLLLSIVKMLWHKFKKAVTVIVINHSERIRA